MAEREASAILDEIRSQGCNTLSISRLNTLHQCGYQFWLNYIKHVPKKIGIYGAIGSVIHDAIEGCIKGEFNPNDLKEHVAEELDNLEAIGVAFPLDRNGNSTIKKNFVANINRFADEFSTPNGKFDTEELLTLKIDDKNYMIGYADAIKYCDDGTVWLIDWKSGHNYTSKDVLEAGRQLCFYKMALEAAGFTVKKVSWCMLKYYKASWTLKNGKTKEKIGEWRNLVKDLRSQMEKEMTASGVSDIEIDIEMAKALESNTIPEYLRNRIKVEIYVRDYQVTKELEEETLAYIRDSIKIIDANGDDENNWSHCNIEENSFFCASLCDFGGKTGNCKYWVDYCEKFNEDDEDDLDIF